MSPEEEAEDEAAAAALAAMKEDAGGSGAADAEAEAEVHGNMQRVKVYCLTNDGQWDDQGTGHITIDYIEGSREIVLAVVDEVDNDTLLLHHITSDNIYKKQDETIISWKDPENSLDLLLSFQETEGCTYIWQSIDYLQKRLQSGDLGYGLKDLPSLELSSLPLLLKTVLEWGTKDGTRVAELISQNDEFFPRLVDLFRTCEGSRNMDGLHMIFRLVKGIISLNNPDIFYKIFSDDFILDIIGALEYDPEVPNVQNLREIVENQILNEAIHIGNVSVASKIRQTYIIDIIKDIISLDGPTVSSLNSIIKGNKSFVVSVLKDDASFIQDLIARITSSNTPAESKCKLILFLHELCFLSKSLEPKGQSQLFGDLIDKGALNIISDVLQSQNKQLFSAGANILEYFVDLHPDLVRTFIANHEENYLEGNSLLEFLVQGMVMDSSEESAEEMIYQSCLKTLLGSSSTITKDQGVVLQVFFDKYIQKLIDVIASSCAPKGIARSASSSAGVHTMAEQHYAKPVTLLKICELLSFCALHHTEKIKTIFLTNEIEKVLTLTHRRENFLVVAAVQFMRIIIGRKDDLLVDRVIKLNLLEPVIKAFNENGDRDNLLQSVVLELLEYIRKENLEALIEYVAESFWGQLVKFERLPSIKAFMSIKLKSDAPEKIVESAETKQSTGVVDMGKKADERGADKEQEGYFNKDSDIVDSSTPTMHSQGQSIPARNPVNADEAQVVGTNPDGGRHSPHKKLKSASASPSRSTKSSEGSGEGDGSRGS